MGYLEPLRAGEVGAGVEVCGSWGMEVSGGVCGVAGDTREAQLLQEKNAAEQQVSVPLPWLPKSVPCMLRTVREKLKEYETLAQAMLALFRLDSKDYGS